MKLKVQHVMDATLVIAQIIRDSRPMPQRGKFRLARMHARLLPEFTTANAQRDEMIRSYGNRQVITHEDPTTGEVTVAQTDQWMVPPDRMPEFAAAWQEIAEQEIEADVQPIPLADLDLGEAADGAISAQELIALGELVAE